MKIRCLDWYLILAALEEQMLPHARNNVQLISRRCGLARDARAGARDLRSRPRVRRPARARARSRPGPPQ